MKVGQKTIVRWMSKLAVKGNGRPSQKQSAIGLREVSADQLRHVSGGDGGSSQLPKTGW
jgi:hypothetical protein